MLLKGESYNYQDRLDGQENLVQDITYSLYTGGAKHYSALLDEVIRAGGNLATEADMLKEQLTAFEPAVPAGKEPVVRVDFCDSGEFTFQKYMSIGEFDEAVAKTDQVLSERNAGKGEDESKTCTIRFTVYYPDKGEMQTLKGTIDAGLDNGGFISTFGKMVGERLTDENWIAYERGKGQAAYGAFVTNLTNIRDNVLPYLQSFCNGQERDLIRAETAQTVPIEADGKNYIGTSYAPENRIKDGRNTKQVRSPGERRSIHERLVSNKAKIGAQTGKGNLAKGVERT